MTLNANPLIESFRRAGQGHVFAFFDRLGTEARARLLSEAAEVDLPELDRLVRSLVLTGGAQAVDLKGLSPAPYERLPTHGGDASAWAAA